MVSRSLTQGIHLLDSPEPTKWLIFINESHVIDLAWKRGWQVLLDEMKRTCLSSRSKSTNIKSHILWSHKNSIDGFN